MGYKTGIEWTDSTWNPIRGCSRVSEGCRNCYAETVANRFSGEGHPYEGLIAKGGQWNGNIKLVEHMLDQPLRCKKPRRIFVNSMSDLFHENVPFEFIDNVFSVMAMCPQHTFQILTKRPERMFEYLSSDKRKQWADASVMIWGGEDPDPLHDSISHGDKVLKNVWLGVSVEDQKTADERIPLLMQTPAAVRWISAEPLLGEINLGFMKDHCDLCGGTGILARWPRGKCHICKGKGKIWITGKPHRKHYKHLDWVVVGGESGKEARPMHPGWVRSLRDQCQDAGVPFLFKQWGEWFPRSCWEDNPYLILPDDDFCHQVEKTKDIKRYVCGGSRLHNLSNIDFLGDEIMHKVGKKKAGRLLGGRTWDEYPDIKVKAFNDKCGVGE